MGVYIGASFSNKGIDALVRRVQTRSAGADGFFVAGAELRNVARAKEGFLETHPRSLSLRANPKTAREEIAELYLLAKCKQVINDGRPSESVLDIVDVLRRTFALSKDGAT